MKRLLISTTAIALLAGCATLPQGATTDKGKIAQAAVTNGAISCGVGLLAGKLLGTSARTGCIASAVTGGITGAIRERQRQVDEANRLAEQARRQGLRAQVTVGDVQQANQPAHKQLKSMSIDLPADTSTADVQQLLVRAAVMSDASSTPVTITVFGSRTQRQQTVGVLRSALRADSRTIVNEEDGKPALVLSPAPTL